MALMIKTPLLSIGADEEIPEVTAETWTLTLAHYEEAFTLMEWLHNAAPSINNRATVVHRHTRSTAESGPQVCNVQCMLVTWVQFGQPERGGDAA